jgi:hypothetical protein
VKKHHLLTNQPINTICANKISALLISYPIIWHGTQHIKSALGPYILILPSNSYSVTKQSGRVVTLYIHIWEVFISNSGGTPTILTEVFCGCPQPPPLPPGNAGTAP